jgi:MoaA/NifB/PqqE/SkfB family radical SAM enzyme
MTPSRPVHVFLETTIECNLRCVQCDIYKLRNPAGELTAAERGEVIRQVAEWDGSVRLVFAGGEPFLRKSVLYDVAAAAREHSVYTTLSTNGTLITADDVERLPHSGIRCVVVSIDSDVEVDHDRIRGVPGTFRRATATLRALVDRRDRARADFSVLASAIIGGHNLDRVEPMVALFEGVGVDTILFQPVQPNFAREVVPAWWMTSPLFPKDRKQVESGIDRLQELKRSGRKLFQTEAQFEDMRTYFRNPDSIHPGHCGSADRNIMVDIMGDVRLCFNMERIGLRPVANVRQRRLRDIWEDAEVERSRRVMRTCREGCGAMVCHAR